MPKECRNKLKEWKGSLSTKKMKQQPVVESRASGRRPMESEETKKAEERRMPT